MEGDEFFEEDLPAARELVETVGPELAELFIYPGDQHLFTDRSLPAYDAEAAGLVLQRSLAFLDRLWGRLARVRILARVVATLGLVALVTALLVWWTDRPDHSEGDAEVVATGLEVPWGLSFLPTGDALVGERMTGDIYEIPADGGERTLVGTVPDVEPLGEGGLLGIAVDPLFIHDSFIYAYLTPRPTTASCGSGSSRTSRASTTSR